MRHTPIAFTAAAIVISVASSALAGTAIGAKPAAAVPAASNPPAPKLGPPPKETPALTVQAPVASLVKAKLTSLTLAQTTLTPANPASVVFSLQADRAIANCQLEYELRTNLSGPDAINISIINPLDYASPTGGAWPLPIQGQKMIFGSLFFNGKDRLGGMRFFLRAKNTPNNTCTGEAHADFEIKAATPPVLQMDTSGWSTITGVTVAPDWYNFLKKEFTVAIQGKGAQDCAYEVEFKNDTLRTTVSGAKMEGKIPQILDSFSQNLTAGNYTITVKPGVVSNTNNPTIHPCLGKATVKAKVTAPPDAMGIASTSMHVTKKNATAVTVKDISMPIDDLKAISIDVNFKNSMNVLHNTPNSCAYKVATVWPQGGSSEGYYIAQGVADKGLKIDVNSPGISGKGPGLYIIRVEGTTAVPGNNHATPCLGGSFEHKVTLVAPVSQLQIQTNEAMKK